MKRYMAILICALLFLCLNSAHSNAEWQFDPSKFYSQDSFSRRDTYDLSRNWQYVELGKNNWRACSAPDTFAAFGRFVFKKILPPGSHLSSENLQLNFEGVDGPASVYLNNKLLGRHGYITAPFSFLFDKEYIHNDRENKLIVEIDNQLNYLNTLPVMVRDRGIPVKKGAIFRPVKLISGRPPYISKVVIRPTMLSDQQVLSLDLEVKISNHLLPDSLKTISGEKPIFFLCEVQVFQISPFTPISNQSKTYTIDKNAPIQFGFEIADPLEWTPERPVMYGIKVGLMQDSGIIDHVFLHFGLPRPREWLFKYSSQKPSFVVKAIDWVEDKEIRSLSEQDLKTRLKQDIQRILDLGANTVRVLASSPPQYFLNICDSLGLAVLLEIPIVNQPSGNLQNQKLQENAFRAVTEMIMAYMHHPCIAAWGLGNGYDGSDLRTDHFLHILGDTVKTLDDRPVYAGFRKANPSFLNSALDFHILQILPEELVDLVQGRRIGGKNTIYQCVSPILEDSRWGQSVQAMQFRNVLNKIKDSDVLGVLISPLLDWRGDTPHTFWGPGPQIDLFMAGLLNRSNEPRLSYQVVGAFYRNESLPELTAVENKRSDPTIFHFLGIGLIIIIIFFIKKDKRFGYYLHRLFVYPHGFYMDLSENRHVNAFLTGINALLVNMGIAMIIASFLYYFRTLSYFDEILTWLLPAPEQKYKVIWLIWHPAALICSITLLLILLSLIQSIILKVVVFFQHRNLKFSQLLAFVFWVPTNLIFTIPLGIVLFRALDRFILVQPCLIYLVLLVFWFFVRTIRGLKVLLQVSVIKAFLFQFGTCIIIFFLISIYFQNTQSFFSYLQYYWSLLSN